MEVVHKKFTSRKNEMLLYMEVADKPIDDKVYILYIINSSLKLRT